MVATQCKVVRKIHVYQSIVVFFKTQSLLAVHLILDKQFRIMHMYILIDFYLYLSSVSPRNPFMSHACQKSDITSFQSLCWFIRVWRLQKVEIIHDLHQFLLCNICFCNENSRDKLMSTIIDFFYVFIQKVVELMFNQSVFVWWMGINKKLIYALIHLFFPLSIK